MTRRQVISARTVALYEVEPWRGSEEYAEGYSLGIEWGEADMSAGLGLTHDEIARLREEADTEHRWQRAFYLGALRGYRSVVRTLRAGRWGT
jgi:hypothetical protein